MVALVLLDFDVHTPPINAEDTSVIDNTRLIDKALGSQGVGRWRRETC